MQTLILGTASPRNLIPERWPSIQFEAWAGLGSARQGSDSDLKSALTLTLLLTPGPQLVPESYGKLPVVAAEYFAALASNHEVLGSGMAMEGIEQNPVVYEFASELPFW